MPVLKAAALHRYRSVYSVVQHIAIGAEDLVFGSGAGQIGHSVANGSVPLSRFYEAVLPRRKAADMDPSTRYTLPHNTESNEELILFDLRRCIQEC